MEIIALANIVPVILFIFVATITPGPNNLMLAASGMRFGLRATLPHILGIHLGLYTLIIMASFGLNQLLLNLPGMMLFLRIFGSLYLLYLAWKIVGFSFRANQASIAKPFSIIQAGIFQFANPKAWVMSTSAMALAIPSVGSANAAAILLCCTWATIGTCCNCMWVLSGVKLNRFLENPKICLSINIGLASLTAAAVILFWIG